VCHSGDKPQGKLSLNSREAIFKGGSRGPAVVPGAPEKSWLIKAIRQDDETLKMPMGKKLSAQQIADLTQWVKIGAPFPEGGRRKAEGSGQHWAFQPVKRPAVPTVKNKWWVANPIDAFILAKLEAKGLKPNPTAARRELMRRASYDLTGLPPLPQEVEAFVNDKSPKAWENLIDRLLASPQYGEKWGRHWLDLVRYAETNSYERDNPKPNAWRYRDYVIRSFNEDKPYDQFIREQLAGDELPSPSHDAIIATGFYRLGIWDDEPTDREQARYDELDDIITTTGQVLLGLTLDCARCHDHKIDPIKQKDYYAMLAFFNNVNHFRNGGPTDEKPLFNSDAERQDYERKVRELEEKKRKTQNEIFALENEIRRQFPNQPLDARLINMEGARVLGKERFDVYNKLKRQRDDLNRERVPVEMALCVTEAGSRPPQTFVLMRGNPSARADAVEPAFPAILEPPAPALTPPAADARTTGRRLALANWLTSPDNRLSARVMVNRLWQHHFGRGIVRSTNNFGLQGDKPTHPELLDWLAATFVAKDDSIPHPSSFNCNWSLKKMHRLILLSNTYKMSSRPNPQALKADQENDLFWRFNMRRLTAEEIRDSILAVTGVLNLKQFGPSVYPEIPPEVLHGQSRPGYGWGKSPIEEQNRRSIYVHVKRSLLVPILESFDVAETDRTSPVRFASTQPTQALLMLNSTFLNKQADAFAARLKKEAGDDGCAQVRLALSLATQRPPTDKEIQRGVRLIESLKTQDGCSPETAMKYFCLTVLNLNEFVYLD
jgi:hypothetical protein